MGVDAAEAERGDASEAGALGPRFGLRRDAEASGLERGVWLLAVEARRQDAVVERERGLDQARRASGRHRVTDHRLDRAKCGALAGRRTKELAERHELDLVADGRRRTVRLDEPDPGRVVRCGPPGIADRGELAVGARPHRRGLAPIARDARAQDRRVDPVAGALRIGEALQHDDAAALADHDSVGAPIERADVRGLAECAELREHRPERDVVADMDAPGEHDITAMIRELAAALIDREQRARTRRIDRVGRPAQIEAVRDP